MPKRSPSRPSDPHAVERLWRTPDPKRVVRRRHRRRRRARTLDGLLPREEPRHHERRRAGAWLARRREHGPQHDGRALELPVGRERGDLRVQPEALGVARGRARLRRDAEPARRRQPGAQPPRRPRGEAARLREPRQRHRLRMARARRSEGLPADHQHLARRPVPGARRLAAAPGRHRAPRPRRLGLRARRRPARRGHHPELRGHGLPDSAATRSSASRRLAGRSRPGPSRWLPRATPRPWPTSSGSGCRSRATRSRRWSRS